MVVKPWLTERPSHIVAALIAFGLTSAFALYARHAWEDWYITFRASKNLALGHGLVFTPGEHVHSFTSPLGTLVPALLSFLVGPENDDAVLWLFRLVGALLLGAAAWAVVRLSRAAGAGVGVAVFTAVLACTDARVVDFATNGMETAFMAAFLAANLLILSVARKRLVLWLGLSWAALMWTRPDAFIYFGSLALAWLIFLPPSEGYGSRIALFKKMCAAALVALALYAPWVIWATWFYGSPIPHTVIAKGLQVDATLLEGVVRRLMRIVQFPMRVAAMQSSVEQMFMPPRGFGGWPGWMAPTSFALSLAATLYWLAPWAGRHARALSFALLPSHLYLTTISVSIAAWYVAIVTFLTCICLGLMLSDTLKAAAGQRWRLAPVGAAAALIAFSGWSTAAVAEQARVMQIVVEDGNRRQIGLWLREQAAPGDTVFVECLGYISFFSGLKMYDYPGLSSPEVVSARRRLLESARARGEVGYSPFADVIRELQPDWVVLRPWEAQGVEADSPGSLGEHYERVRTFDVTDAVLALPNVPGRHALILDSAFEVYRRRS